MEIKNQSTFDIFLIYLLIYFWPFKSPSQILLPLLGSTPKKGIMWVLRVTGTILCPTDTPLQQSALSCKSLNPRLNPYRISLGGNLDAMLKATVVFGPTWVWPASHWCCPVPPRSCPGDLILICCSTHLLTTCWVCPVQPGAFCILLLLWVKQNLDPQAETEAKVPTVAVKTCKEFYKKTSKNARLTWLNYFGIQKKKPQD